MTTKKGRMRFITDFSLCDRTHFAIVKGISICGIVLVHLCNRYLNFPYLSPLAGAFVAVFLLCSGYGLAESFDKKQNLQGYWFGKIVKVWIPSFLKLSAVAILSQLSVYQWLTEYPAFLYGRYLQLLFGEYLAFWLVFRFVKAKKMRVICLFAISVVAFFLIRSQIYAEQLLCFPLGVAFSQLGWKEKTAAWGAKKILLFLGVGVVVAGSAFVFRNTFSYPLVTNLVWLVFKLSLAILLCLSVFFVRKMGVFSLFVPFGTYSYMLYLINNNVLALLENRVTWYYVVLVLIVMMIAAMVFKWLSDKITRGCMALQNKMLAKQ